MGTLLKWLLLFLVARMLLGVLRTLGLFRGRRVTTKRPKPHPTSQEAAARRLGDDIVDAEFEDLPGDRGR